MATIGFKRVDVNLGGLVPDSNGIVKTECTTTYATNVISAGVSLQSWKVSFSNHHDIKVLGAGVENVSFDNNTVSFTAWLQMFDTVNKIVPGDSQLAVLVSTTVE